MLEEGDDSHRIGRCLREQCDKFLFTIGGCRLPLKPAKKLDVMVAGDLFVDIVMSGFSFWPQPGQEAVAESFCREVGGGAAITASGLAKLGSRVGVLGVVGSDIGNWIVDSLRSMGIDTAGIAYDVSEPTAFSVAISSPEERTFFTYIGANCRFPGILREAANGHLLAHARHVHLASSPDLDTAPELLDELRQNGCSISLDVGWHQLWLEDPRSLAILPQIDIFFPNDREAEAMTGEHDPERVLKAYAHHGARGVALKLGPRGAALLWNGEITFVDAYAVEPVDTTGAGDCFDAGFLYAWLNGDDLRTCLRSGAICGALSTLALGGVTSFPTLHQLRKAMKQTTAASPALRN